MEERVIERDGNLFIYDLAGEEAFPLPEEHVSKQYIHKEK